MNPLRALLAPCSPQPYNAAGMAERFQIELHVALQKREAL